MVEFEKIIDIREIYCTINRFYDGVSWRNIKFKYVLSSVILRFPDYFPVCGIDIWYLDIGIITHAEYFKVIQVL